MSPEWIEGRLGFDFSCATGAVARPETAANPLKCVDVCARYPDGLWLVEVKDPEGTSEQHREGAVIGIWKEIQNDHLLKSHLLPRLYGTYAYLVEQGLEPRGCVRYGILIGLTDLTAADRASLTDKVQRFVDRIGPKIRHSRHWPVVEVHNIASWNAAHPEMLVTRLP